MKLNNGSTSSRGDVDDEEDDYHKTRIDLEGALNILSRIVKAYVFGDGFSSLLKNSSQSLQNKETSLRTPIWNLASKNKSIQEFIQRERAEMADLVQQKIHTLQNPDDCTKAKKLVCTVDNDCGFGCMIHHIVYCLITGYTTNRTLILNLRTRYKGRSWKKTFLPLSSTCLDGSGATYGIWGGGGEDISAQVLAVGTFGTMGITPGSPWAPLRPKRIPSQFKSRLRKISKDPLIWWVGQFASYVMRLRPETEKIIEEAKEKIVYEDSNSFATNTDVIQFGIHVRRTDKLIAEAKSYPLETYLRHVERHLKLREKLEGKPISGHIFLASDEPKVIKEARELEKKSNKWTLWANESNAKDAEKVYNRFERGILGILTDVMLLVECEFVVCTFSSNICRLVAELKEAELNVRGEVVSIDDPYTFLSYYIDVLYSLYSYSIPLITLISSLSNLV
ncbi:unnamed protein product [Orchesella dallaii]|uniref:GT23 domain-containing protein n=1 Tax=Orchesella dallaii TaxID=48710 RepID=A0ABP1R7G9_9HEXA